MKSRIRPSPAVHCEWTCWTRCGLCYWYPAVAHWHKRRGDWLPHLRYLVYNPESEPHPDQAGGTPPPGNTQIISFCMTFDQQLKNKMFLLKKRLTIHQLSKAVDELIISALLYHLCLHVICSFNWSQDSFGMSVSTADAFFSKVMNFYYLPGTRSITDLVL